MLRSYADGIFFGERHGVAPSQILGLHGWGRTHTDLTGVLDGFDAIALDLPGFGSSPSPTTGWTTAEYAAALDPVLDEMARPVVILGHSFGGRVAVHVAVRRPASVAGLVLCGVPLLHRSDGPARSSPMFRLGRVLHRMGIVSDDRMEAMRDKYGSSDYRNTSGVMREVFVKAVNEVYDEPMGKITCPVELVWGDADTETPADIATRSEGLLADATLTIVGGSDHWLPISDPQPVREAIARRLNATIARNQPGEDTTS